MKIINNFENLELIYWYPECFSVKFKEKSLNISLNPLNINSSSGFFLKIAYPLILYTESIVKCKLIIKLKNTYLNCLKIFNGISWFNFTSNNNILTYEGDIQICKRIRIGFLENSYELDELIFEYIKFDIDNKNLNKYQDNSENINIVEKNNLHEKFKTLDIKNIKEKNGIMVSKCHNIPYNLLHLKYALILNYQHYFVSRENPFEFIDMHPFDIKLTPQKIDIYISQLKSNFNNFSIVDTPLFYLDYHFSNYCHFYKDTVSYVNLFLELRKKIPNLKILLFNKEYPHFVLDFFNTFNLYNDIYFFEERNKNKTLFKNLYIGKFIINDHDKYFDLVFPFLNKLFNEYYDNNITRTEKFYISRRLRDKSRIKQIGECNYLNRGCLNEIELVDFLKTNKYKEIWIEDYNLIEKIKLFNKCSHLICSAGAFEINLFLIKNCNIKIINSPCYGSQKKENLLKRNINEYYIFNDTSLIYTKELIYRVNQLKENNKEVFKCIIDNFDSYKLNDKLDHNLFIPLLRKLSSGGSYPFIVLIDKLKKKSTFFT